MRIEGPVYGALVVYRDLSTPDKGHVTFVYHQLKNGDIAVLGGNQGDGISLNADIATYNRTLGFKRIGFYVPASYLNYAKNVLVKGGT